MGWWWNGNVTENILSMDGTHGKDSQVLKRDKTHLTRACGTKILATTEQNKEAKGPGLAYGGWGSSRLLWSIVGSVENDPKMSQGWFGSGDLIPQLKCPLGKHGDLSLHPQLPHKIWMWRYRSGPAALGRWWWGGTAGLPGSGSLVETESSRFS